MDVFASGIAGSLIAGVILWSVTHHADIAFLLASRRRREQISGDWHVYHISRDSSTSRRAIWVEHEDNIRVNLLGRLRGVSRAHHGSEMTYRLSGQIRGPALRIYLENQDAHEARASVFYPNLLGGTVLMGILVGEDFDRQWYASPSIMSREPLSVGRLTELAKQLRINRPPPATAASGPTG